MQITRSALKRFFLLGGQDNCLVSQVLFFVACGLWFAGRILLAHTSFMAVLKPFVSFSTIRMCCFAILLLRELAFGQWNRRTFIGLALFVFLGNMAQLSGTTVVIDALVLVFAGRNVPFRKIALFCVALLAGIIAATVISSLLGIVPDTVIVTASGRERHRLGFAHPNNGAAFAFFAMCLWIFIRGKKLGLIDVAAMLAVAVTFFVLTYSRTSFGLSILVIACGIALRWIPDKILESNAVRVLSVGAIALIAIAGVLLAVAYDPDLGWMKTLDSLMSGRLSLGHAAIEKYGFAITGQHATLVGARRFDLATGEYVARKNAGIIVDCIYVRLVLSCGVLFTAVVIALATLVVADAHKRRQWYLVLVLVFVAIHGLSETCCMYLSYNPFLFLLGELFYSRKPDASQTALLMESEEPGV